MNPAWGCFPGGINRINQWMMAMMPEKNMKNETLVTVDHISFLNLIQYLNV